MEDGQWQVTYGAGLVMQYRFLVETADDFRAITISRATGIDHARMILRQKYPFKDWRIVNIAEMPDIPIDEV